MYNFVNKMAIGPKYTHQKLFVTYHYIKLDVTRHAIVIMKVP